MGMETSFQDVPFFLQFQLLKLKQFKIPAFKIDYIQKLQHQEERLPDSITYLKSAHLPSNNKIVCLLLLTINDYFRHDNIPYHLWTPTGRKKRVP